MDIKSDSLHITVSLIIIINLLKVPYPNVQGTVYFESCVGNLRHIKVLNNLISYFSYNAYQTNLIIGLS